MTDKTPSSKSEAHKKKSPNRRRPPSSGSNLRRVDTLLREVEFIQTALDGKKPIDPEKSKLDKFQKQKLELTDLLKRIKEDIKTKHTIESRVPSNAQTIRLKRDIQENIKYAKEEYSKLEAQYNSDLHDVDNGGGQSELNLDDMKQREELCNLLQQDLNYTEHTFKPADTHSKGFRLARDAHANRRKGRDQGLISEAPVPLTGKQQAFIQLSLERDRQLDVKLDIIKKEVRKLNVIGQDINIELEKHQEMLTEVEQKMDHVTDKLENRNKQLKELLKKSGGMTRWCPIFILFIILLACLGYIYNTFV